MMRYNYEEKYMYQFLDVLRALPLNCSYPYELSVSDISLGSIADGLTMKLPAKLGTKTEGVWTESDYVNELFYNLMNRYMYDYVFAINKEYTGASLFFNVPEAIRDLFGKIFNIMIYTYDKYAKLLSIYQNEEIDFLGKLQRLTSGTIDNTGTQRNAGSTNDFRKDNDTPQGSGDFSDDTHASFVSSGNAGSDFTRTDNLTTTSSTGEEWDSEYLMDKLKKIQDSYQNTMYNWVNEFRILFIEGGNVL